MSDAQRPKLPADALLELRELRRERIAAEPRTALPSNDDLPAWRESAAEVLLGVIAAWCAHGLKGRTGTHEPGATRFIFGAERTPGMVAADIHDEGMVLWSVLHYGQVQRQLPPAPIQWDPFTKTWHGQAVTVSGQQAHRSAEAEVICYLRAQVAALGRF